MIQNNLNILSDVEISFTLEAWMNKLRTDKRIFSQIRDVSIEFPATSNIMRQDNIFKNNCEKNVFNINSGLKRGTCLVKLGKTAVISTVAIELVQPNQFAPSVGFLEFNVKNAIGGTFYTTSSSFSSSGYGGHRCSSINNCTTVGSANSSSTVLPQITKVLEAIYKDAGVIDLNSLCVLPGKFVWSIVVDVMVLNDDGNAIDAAQWSATGALMNARRPEVSIIQSNNYSSSSDDQNLISKSVIIHSEHERDFIPLNIHHFPILISFVIVPSCIKINGINNNSINEFVIDPSKAESASGCGNILVAVNQEEQVCYLSKEGLAPVSYFPLIKECIAAAKSLVPKIIEMIQRASAIDEEKRKQVKISDFYWSKSRIGVGRVQ